MRFIVPETATICIIQNSSLCSEYCPIIPFRVQFTDDLWLKIVRIVDALHNYCQITIQSSLVLWTGESCRPSTKMISCCPDIRYGLTWMEHNIHWTTKRSNIYFYIPFTDNLNLIHHVGRVKWWDERFAERIMKWEYRVVVIVYVAIQLKFTRNE